jgi:lysozyme
MLIDYYVGVLGAHGNGGICMTGIMLSGVDVSHHNGAIEWERVAHAGYVFAFIKATEGSDRPDPIFAPNWRSAKAAGMLRSAYHFFSPASSGLLQAEEFLDVAGSTGYDLPPVVDVEQIPGSARTDVYIKELRRWLRLVEDATNIVPWIYTSSRTWRLLGNPTGFSRYGLWVTHPDAAEPALPSGWTGYSAWQFSWSGVVAGCKKPVDLDYLRVPTGSNTRPLVAGLVRRTNLRRTSTKRKRGESP